ncbi:advillin-like [Liolophura sinensis]|uniref:advillin-like n=1 Tax=Liolophura sinensis TaxID=3198878 RepID=UPI00315812FB
MRTWWAGDCSNWSAGYGDGSRQLSAACYRDGSRQLSVGCYGDGSRQLSAACYRDGSRQLSVGCYGDGSRQLSAACYRDGSVERMSQSEVDPAFRVIPKRQTCFLVWRIENLQVVPVPREHYGNFYKGDSYIVLSVRDVKGSIDIHVHFWLGSQTSQDEAGVAAYKTVELDDHLGGAAVQHREVEGQESKVFMSYFKSRNGIKYLEGGVASGFNHVEHTLRERLMQVKGKHHVRIYEVPITWDSMNHGDVFILDLGKVIYIWRGQKASNTEKMQAAKAANTFRGERGGCDIIFVTDGKESELEDEELKLFDKFLPLNQKQVKDIDEAGADDVVERAAAASIKLYLCTDEGGTLKVTEKKTGPLYKSDLNTQDCYIIDNGVAGIWVWAGKESSRTERKESMRNALGFINKKEYPSSTPITRVVQGGEPIEFKCLFKSWPQPQASGKVYIKNRIAKTVQTKFDASTLHSNRLLAAETQMVDDGSGDVEIWRIEDFEMVPLKGIYYGQFFGGDCYIVLYNYKTGGQEHSIIYYWQGLKSTADERGTSALKAVELDDKMGGRAVQVRVVQYKEPPHFMAIFRGRMIIFEGGKAGWNKEERDDGPGDRYMLQVRGTSMLNTKAVQVPMRASSLNSNDVFVIFGARFLYIWCGKGSTGDEREMAKRVAHLSNREQTMVFEGQEKKDFWNVLGGKEDYASDKRLQEEETAQPARLFQCSNASGVFTVDEIPDFTQSDLVSDDVMLLDACHAIFVWVGDGANEEEKRLAQTVAFEYLETDPAHRDPDTPVMKIRQGYEPPNFTGFFGVWDRELWNKGMSIEEMEKDLAEGNQGIQIVKETVEAAGTLGFSEVAKYPYEELAHKPTEELPAGVNPSCKEIHLTEEDFEKVFKMKHSEFLGKPVWKQVQMKKNTGLF